MNLGKSTPQALRVVGEAAGRPDLVVVLGMHRSGTSAVTRGLRTLGVQLGDRMMLPNEKENPKGYWEDLDVYELNAAVLKALGRDWHSLPVTTDEDVEFLRKQGYMLRAAELLKTKMRNVPIFGFKDPRVAKLLPFWQEVFAAGKMDVGYLIAVRNPLSVARSLARRNDLPREQSYYLWLEHVLRSLDIGPASSHVIVDYDQFIGNPRKELARIAHVLGLQMDDAEVATYESEFVDATLRHTQYTLEDLRLDAACPEIVAEVYGELAILTQEGGNIDSDFVAKLKQWKVGLSILRPALTFADRLAVEALSLSRESTLKTSEAEKCCRRPKSEPLLRGLPTEN